MIYVERYPNMAPGAASWLAHMVDAYGAIELRWDPVGSFDLEAEVRFSSDYRMDCGYAVELTGLGEIIDGPDDATACWRVSGQGAAGIVRAIGPYLRTHAVQASLVLDLADYRREHRDDAGCEPLRLAYLKNLHDACLVLNRPPAGAVRRQYEALAGD